MQQHAEPVHYPVPASPRRGEKVGFERHIDDVGDHAAGRQQRQIDRERRCAFHAEARGIDEEPGAVQDSVPVLPGVDRDPRRRRRQGARERRGARPAAVDEADFADPLFDQRRRHAARAAAGSEHDRRSRRGLPVGRRLAQVFAKAVGVGIARFEAAVRRDDDRIDGADPPRDGVDPVDDRERRLLVRKRQVAAAKAERRQSPQGLFEPLRRHRQRHIGAVDGELFEPEAVQHRRAGVADRPAHDAREARSAGDPHRRPLIAAARRGRAGRRAGRTAADPARRNNRRRCR
jgi:hypothetical protein